MKSSLLRHLNTRCVGHVRSASIVTSFSGLLSTCLSRPSSHFRWCSIWEPWSPWPRAECASLWTGCRNWFTLHWSFINSPGVGLRHLSSDRVDGILPLLTASVHVSHPLVVDASERSLRHAGWWVFKTYTLVITNGPVISGISVSLRSGGSGHSIPGPSSDSCPNHRHA